MTTTIFQFELQLFDNDEDYKVIGTYLTQADAEAAIDCIPDELLRDYVGIRIIDWNTESEVVEYLIPGQFQIVS
jgi:hypothetical protein